jgi:hypothetical protein
MKVGSTNLDKSDFAKNRLIFFLQKAIEIRETFFQTAGKYANV